MQNRARVVRGEIAVSHLGGGIAHPGRPTGGERVVRVEREAGGRRTVAVGGSVGGLRQKQLHGKGAKVSPLARARALVRGGASDSAVRALAVRRPAVRRPTVRGRAVHDPATRALAVHGPVMHDLAAHGLPHALNDGSQTGVGDRARRASCGGTSTSTTHHHRPCLRMRNATALHVSAACAARAYASKQKKRMWSIHSVIPWCSLHAHVLPTEIVS